MLFRCWIYFINFIRKEVIFIFTILFVITLSLKYHILSLYFLIFIGTTPLYKAKLNLCLLNSDNSTNSIKLWSIALQNFTWISSFLINTHLSLHQILRAAYYWANHSSSTLTTIQTEANLHSRTTIIDYYNYFRDICQEWALRVQVNERLGGLGRVIEVDESKLFHAKYNRGDMLRRTYDWVFGLLERDQ